MKISEKFLFFALFSISSLFAQRLPFKNYTTKDGLAQSQVTCILQDSKGYLWLGSLGGGVSRFDGITFRNFSTEDGLPGNYIRNIVEDPQGTLWFAAEGGGISSYRDRQFENMNLNKIVPGIWVRDLFADKEGAIWLALNDGVGIWKNNKFEKFPVPFATRDSLVHFVFQDKEKNLWLGTPHGIYFLHEGQWKHFTTRDGLAEDYVRGISQSADGKIWIETRKNVCTYQQGKITVMGQKDGFPTTEVLSVYFDRDGNTWIGSNEGVWKHSARGLEKFSDLQGLVNNVANSFYQDREGNMWIGTDGGLSELSHIKILNYTREHGFENHYIYGINETNPDEFWFGTGEGVGHLANGKISNFHLVQGKGSKVVYTIFKRERPKELWFGTASEGIYIYRGHPGEFHHLVHPKIPNDISVRYILEDRSGWIWFTTSTHGVFRIKENLVENYNNENSLAGNTTWGLMEDRLGNIWIGTDNGVVKYSNGKFFRWNIADGLVNNGVSCFDEDRMGYIWIATDGGVSRLDPQAPPGKQFKNFTIRDGLTNNTIWSILVDSRGWIWFGSAAGLDRYDGSTFKNFNVNDGMADSETNFNALCEDHLGNIWIGTVGGAVKYIPAEDRPVQVPPLVQIESIQILGQNIPIRGNVRLSYRQNFLVFQYAGLCFYDPQAVRYQYRLVGLENRWSEPVSYRQVNFTNLDPGEYRLEIKAANKDKIWSDIQSFSFVISSPFWKTWWFISLGILILGFSAFTVYQTRVSVIKARHAELEKKVKERTRDMEFAMNRLIDTQTQLIQSEKMASLGQMVAGVAHEINNPVTFILANIPFVQEFSRSAQDLITHYEKVVGELKDREALALQELQELKKEINLEFLLKEVNKVTYSIEYGARRIAQIVRDLKNFSRPEEGSTKPTDLNECIELTLNVIPELMKKNARIQTSYAEIPKVNCFASQINQVIINLMMNSLHAIQPGGNIWIKTKANSDWVTISVKDDGSGIPEEIQSKIFDPFFTTKPVGHGTGLGLAISYSIMERHKGKLYFQSPPANEKTGAEFFVELPIQSSTESV